MLRDTDIDSRSAVPPDSAPGPSPRARGHRTSALGTLASFLLLVLLVPVLPARGLLPTDAVWVDIVSSFAVQGLLLALLAIGVLAWRRRWLRAASFVLLLVPDLVNGVPALFESPTAARPLGVVYAANLGQSSAAVRAATEQILALEPDLVWLSEFPSSLAPEVLAEFEAVEDRYLYGVSWQATAGRSLKFLSRFPLLAREVFEPERAPGRPALRLQLDADGIPLVVFALHTHPPIAEWALGARNESLDWVARMAARADADVLLMGDLNTSVFSPRFHRLIRQSGLTCPSVWRCAVASWPAQAPVLLTPIDHVLSGGDLVVTRRRRGGDTGSDHYPVIAEIGYRAP